MNLRRFSALVGAALVLPLLPLSATAGDGHDHGPAVSVTSSRALPRFTAESDLFELVGVINGKQVTLFLDHAVDNAPVNGAKLEVELGGVKLEIKPHGDGEFEATLAQALTYGVLAVTASVTTAKASDLLAGELDLHQPAAAEVAHEHGWGEYAGGLAGILVSALGLWWLLRRWMTRRSPVPPTAAAGAQGSAT